MTEICRITGTPCATLSFCETSGPCRDRSRRRKPYEQSILREDQAPVALRDPIIESVRAKLLACSAVGIAKYGTTLARTDLSRLAWLRHLQEGLLDAAGYVERLIQDEERKA